MSCKLFIKLPRRSAHDNLRNFVDSLFRLTDGYLCSQHYFKVNTELGGVMTLKIFNYVPHLPKNVDFV